MKKQIFTDPLIDNNPITKQVLGICSALAVTVKVEQAIAMAIALTFVLTFSNIIISSLRKWIPFSVRMIVQLTVIASMVIFIDKLLLAYMYDLSKELSVFDALIITNCIVMGRAEAFAMQNSIKESALDGLGNSFGYSSILIIVSAFREFFGFGTLLNVNVIPSQLYIDSGGWYINNGLMLLAPGAFIILGLIIWVQKSIYKSKESS